MKLKIQSNLISNYQLIIMIRKADNLFQVTVRLIDPGYEATIDLSGCQIGDKQCHSNQK